MRGHSVKFLEASLAQMFDFLIYFSEEGYTCIVIVAKILNVMDECLMSNPLLLDSEPIYGRVIMTSVRSVAAL